MSTRKNVCVLMLVFALCIAMLTACGGAASSEIGSNAPVSASEGTPESSVVEKPAQTNDANEAYNPSATGAYEDGSTPEFSGVKLRLTIDGEEVVITMYDNTAVDALLERLPMEDLSFFDLSGIEKPIEQLEEPLSLGEEKPGYAPVAGEMVIYRPWGNFTIFYGDFRYSPELVPLGKVESGLEVLAGKTEDFTGVLELMEVE